MNILNHLRQYNISATMSFMRRKNQNGSAAGLVVLLIVLVLSLFGSLAFGFWAYSGRQNYKNNTDQIVAAAVTKAVEQTQQDDTVKNAEADKNPLRSYISPPQFGSVTIQYPKTWSAYVDDSGSGGGSQVNGYFQLGTVPSTTNPASVFALRLQVLSQPYSSSLQQYTNTGTNAPITAVPFSPPKVSSAVGVRLTGQILPNKQGDMIILPLRDKTLLLWTESSSFEADFNKYIVPNFSFSP